MTPRLNPFAVNPELTTAFVDFAYKVQAELEPSLAELVKIRASQINGCAVCLHMHTQEARKNGETNERLDMVAVWRESSLYTVRERAALAWTEALTLVAETHAPDDVYQAMAAQFTEGEQVRLTLLITVINGFNRIGVGFRMSHPASAPAQAAA